jgi:RNA polymerase sigma-70 factor (ECF subfamily)
MTHSVDTDPQQVTVLLRAWAGGDTAAGDQLFPLIYRELRRISEVQLRRSARPVTLDPTEVLHEAYLRLADQKVSDWRNRAHFFALAATVVRRILLDHARHRLAARRDRRVEVALETHHHRHLMSEARADELLQLDEALSTLFSLDSRRARVVELRYFGGLSVEETAEVLGVGTATVKRDWALARAWLRSRIREGPPGEPPASEDP